ncbi:MAG: basic amino acid/polyamine antiporter, family [Abditibacteriota bacterium]|nr:basic amino acid/polyamine antiporter, family [Abditibacteriota bacterium]
MASPVEAVPATPAHSHTPQLARTMGLGALTIYGVGDMLGAGVYGVIGKWAGVMGNALWAAFAAAMVGALLTGLSYASLGSRYPRAAGASFITQRAFGFPFLSFMVGLAVAASGLTSFATQSHAFSGYFLGFFGLKQPGTESVLPAATFALWAAVIIGFILVLAFINFWGMKEATWVNILCTMIEISGLAIVLIVGARYWGSVNYLEVPRAPNGSEGALGLSLIVQGAALTFYSFIGFEDMINVSEEVKDPKRNFPRAVMAALSIATLIYIAIAITVISVVPYTKLATSSKPLVDVVTTAAPGFPIAIFSFIALFAIANTGLLNYIMSSRLLYGMARMGFVPRKFGEVHPVRQTPHIAIGVLMFVVLCLAFAGDVSKLSVATTILLLSVFILINASLLKLKMRPEEPKGSFEVPSLVPFLGMLVCGAMLLSNLIDEKRREAFPIALGLLAGIAVLYFIARPKNINEESLAEASTIE